MPTWALRGRTGRAVRGRSGRSERDTARNEAGPPRRGRRGGGLHGARGLLRSRRGFGTLARRLCTVTLLVLAPYLFGGCKRPETFEVTLSVRSEASDTSALALTQASLEEALRSAVAKHRGFRIEGQAAEPWRLALEVPLLRLAQAEGGTARIAVAHVLLSARHGRGGAAREYEGGGLSERDAGSTQADGQRALGEALAAALEEAVGSLHALLWATRKPDPALIADLSSERPELKAGAVRVLLERRRPEVLPILLGELQTQDAVRVRRAIGQLVELGRPEAVEPLIELGRGKSYGFVREIVYAVGALGGPEAEAYLDTVAEGHDQGEVRAAAREALNELRAGRRKPQAPTGQERPIEERR